MATVPGWAHYRPSAEAGVNCGTCDFFTAGRCEMFDNAPVKSDYVCDRWEGHVDKAETNEGFDTSYEPEATWSRWDHDEIKGGRELRNQLEPMEKGDGKLIVISHAKTRYNQPGQPSDMVQGWRDIPLDNQGRTQARNVGKFLKTQGVSKILSSDLKRATQTADIASRVAGIPTEANAAFRPWNLGNFAGHSSADVIPKLEPYITSPEKKVPGGESFQEYQDRFLPALEKLLNRVDKGETVALVTHSRNLEAIEGWLGGNGYRQKIDPDAINEDKTNPATALLITKNRQGKFRVGRAIDLRKAQAHPLAANLRVHGMSVYPDGTRSYRMVTRDGHYVGRTNATKVRARKGEVLKVQANDFLQDVNRNVIWTNPNVVRAGYDDAPHSWAELEAMAGRELEKDFAPGPAGDVPASPDTGDPAGAVNAQTGEAGALAATEGPTISDVHVNVPLPNISVAYMQGGKKRTLRYEIHKADKMKQLVYGVVLEPNVLDAQDDFMLPNQVEKSAHTYLKKAIRGVSSVAKLQHRAQGFKKTSPSIVPVESFVAPVDFSYDGKDTIKAGSWVMCMHVEDPNLWQDFLDGKYTGFSVGGTGIRRAFNYPETDVPGGYIRPPQAADYAPEVAHMMSGAMAKAIQETVVTREPEPVVEKASDVTSNAPVAPQIVFSEGAFQINLTTPEMKAPDVHVHPDIHVEVKPPERRGVTVTKNKDGSMSLVPEEK